MPFADVDTTDVDGSFSVSAPAGALNGQETTVIAYHSGMFFTPDRYSTPVVNNGEYTVNFQGLRLSAITGRVVDANGSGMEGVKVTAAGGTVGGPAGVTEYGMTTQNGRYNIRVPWGRTWLRLTRLARTSTTTSRLSSSCRWPRSRSGRCRISRRCTMVRLRWCH